MNGLLDKLFGFLRTLCLQWAREAIRVPVRANARYFAVKRHPDAERGNIFFMLFGAVAIVGVLGAATVSLMRGPLSTMVEVNRRTMAESQMSIASKLGMMTSALQANDGDCEAVPDGFVEPYEWQDASGAGPDGVAGSEGGGWLANAYGVSKKDPWGTNFGYCVWDAGITVADAGCGGAGQKRLAGSGTADRTYPVMALISAGADRTFQTGCVSFATGDANSNGTYDAGEKLVVKGAGSDDVVLEYTYAEASMTAGGLWELKSGQPNVAETPKSIEVGGGANFAGGSALIDPTTGQGTFPRIVTDYAQANTQPTIDFVDGLKLTNTASAGGTCSTGSGGPGLGTLAVDAASPTVILGCLEDSGNQKWTILGGVGVNKWVDGTDSGDIHYPGGMVGIGTVDPDKALDVVGDAALTGDVFLANTKGVRWGDATTGVQGSGPGSLEMITGGSTRFTIDSSGLAGLGVAPAASTRLLVQGIGTSSATAALNVTDSAGSSILYVQDDKKVGIGVVPNDALDVAGAADVSLGYKIDGNVVVYVPDTLSENILVGKDAGSLASGDRNAVLGGSAASALAAGTDNVVVGQAGAAGLSGGTYNVLIGQGVGPTLTAGNRNILIGAHDSVPVDVPAATTDDYLNIGNTIFGKLATDQVGIGVPNPNDTLDVAGTIDATGNINTGGNLTINSVVFGPAAVCTSAQKLQWNNASGWSCVTDLNDGSAGSPDTLEEVLTAGNDANTLTAVNLGGVAIGSNTLSTGGTQDLELDVTGDIGADWYCDADGNNCFSAASVGSIDTFLELTDTPNAYTGSGTWLVRVNAGATGLEFVNPATLSTAAAGNTGEVQYNNGGAFAASANFFWDNAAKELGIGTNTPGASLDVATTDSVILPRGTTAQRSGTPVNGMIRYNSTANKFEVYESGVWKYLQTGTATALAFTDLSDTPAVYTGAAYKLAMVNPTETGLIFSYNDAVQLPSGTTAERPGTATNGMIRYNGTNNKFEVYQSGAWVNLITSGAGSALAIDDLTDAYTEYATDHNFIMGRTSATALTAGAQYNLFIGEGSGATTANSTATTDANVAIGYQALLGMTSGGSNVAVGTGAGDSITSGSGNIVVGYNVDTPAATTSNFLNIGDTIYGDLSTDQIRIGGSGALSGFSDLDVTGTLAVKLSAGTTAQRPGTATNGMIRYNSTANKFEVYENGAWKYLQTATATALAFTDLSDTPAVYTGAAYKLAMVNPTETGLIFSYNDAVLLPSGATADRPATATDGMIRYNSTTNKFEGYQNGGWADMIGGPASSLALSSITAAAADNAINSGAWNQTWNWALTGATEDAFTFGESTASTGGSGDQSILKATTLASSTAVPLMVTNLGDDLSLRVNDDTDDSDTSPFVVDANGNVGIGSASPYAKLRINSDGVNPLLLIEQGGGDRLLLDDSGGSAVLTLHNGAQTPIVSLSTYGSSYLYFTNGRLGVGTTSPGALGHYVETSTTGNAIMEVMRLSQEDSDSAAANGIGAALTFNLETATDGTNAEAAQIAGVWDDATDNSKDGSLRFYTMGPNATSGTTTATERMRVDSYGSVLIGDTTPVSPVAGRRSLEIGGGYAQIFVRNDMYGLNTWGDLSSQTAVEHSPGKGYSGGINVITPGGNVVGGVHVAMGTGLSATNYYSIIGLREAGSVWNGDGALSSGDYLPGIAFSGQTSSSQGTGATIGAAINGVVSGSVSHRVLPTDLIFRTSTTDSSGLTEYMRIKSAGDITMSGTGALKVPSGTTAQQPGTATNGMIRYNSTTNKFEAYQNGAWVDMIGGGTPAGSNTEIQYNNAGAFGASSDLAWVSGALELKTTSTGNVPVLKLRTTAGAGNAVGLALYNNTSTLVGRIYAYDNSMTFRTEMASPLYFQTNALNRMTIDSAGSVLIGTTTPTTGASLKIGTTDSIMLPSGTTAQRPGTPVNGMIRYNSTTNLFEAYQNGTWTNMTGIWTDSAAGYLEYANSYGGIKIGSVSGQPAPVYPTTSTSLAFTGLSDVPSAYTSSGYKVVKVNAGASALEFGGADAVLLPSGTTAQRPGTATNGMVRYNSTDNKFEVYQNGSWVNLITSGSGSTLALNDLTDVITNYVGNQNMMLGGGGASLSTGFSNVGLGPSALNGVTSGTGNTAIGRQALQANSDGTSNTVIGSSAMVFSFHNSYNTVVGTGAMGSGQGNANTVVGYNTGQLLNAGQNNTFLGYQSGNSVTDGTGNVLIGYDVDTPAATTNNFLNIGDTIYGDLSTDQIRIGGSGALSGFSDLDVTGTLAVKLSSGTTAQRPGTPTNGMIRYNSTTNKFEGYQNGAWIDMIGSAVSSVALSSITAATADNTINSAAWNQTWNWALTGATEDAFTFGESAASTGGSGDQSILKASTLASSTAVPLMVTNLGNGLSLRVNDDTDDSDVSPFVVDANGKVGIGSASPSARLHINSDTAGQLLFIEQGGGDRLSLDDGGGSSVLTLYNGAQVPIVNLSTYGSSYLHFTNGRLGVGTTTPGALGHYVETSTTGNAIMEVMRLSQEDSNSAAANGIGSALTFNLETATDGTNQEAARIAGVWDDATDNSKDGSLRFYTMGPNAVSGTTTTTERMRVDSYGSVLIGDTTAVAPLAGHRSLEVGGGYGRIFVRNDLYSLNEWGNSSSLTAVEHSPSKGYSGGISVISDGADTVGGVHVAMGSGSIRPTEYYSLIGIRAGGSAWDGMGALSSGDYLPGIGFAGQTSNNRGTGATIGAAINAVVNGTVSHRVLPTDLVFRTSTTDSSGLTEYMRIKSTGDVTLSGTGALKVPSGTTAQQPGTPANGMIRYNTTIGGFEVYEAGAWVAMGASVSDLRLKTDIKPLDRAEIVSKLMQVDTYSFRMKSDHTGRENMGVIAQEIEKIFPDIVDGKGEEMKSVHYVELIAPLIETGKYLKAENDHLRGDVESLKEQVALLNKATAGKTGKASMDGWVMLLLGLAVGGNLAFFVRGGIVFRRRR